MRMTEKGQVTIPKEIRDFLGIGPGSDIQFVRSGSEVRLVPGDRQGEVNRKREAIEEWADRVAGTLDLDGMTPDEYFEWIRGPRDDLDPR